MESSDTTLNRATSPVNCAQDQTSAHVSLMAHPPPTIEKVALHPKNKILRSSNSFSSPDSPLDDPFHDDDDDKSKSMLEKRSYEVSSTKAPPNQVMEDANPSPYRIPPSVFERSPSASPMEWSTASTESLFSIHGGNASFTNEQYLWRSGELGGDGPPGEACTSDRMFSYSGHEGGDGVVADMRSREMGLAEAVMKEVIKESEEGQVYENSRDEMGAPRRSQGSNRSNQSFAFSLATDKVASTRMPSSGRASREQAQTQPQPQAKTERQASSDPMPKTPISTGNEPKSTWFSFLPCC